MVHQTRRNYRSLRLLFAKGPAQTPNEDNSTHEVPRNTRPNDRPRYQIADIAMMESALLANGAGVPGFCSRALGHGVLVPWPALGPSAVLSSPAQITFKSG
jgi:hypothetical protein